MMGAATKRLTLAAILPAALVAWPAAATSYGDLNTGIAYFNQDQYARAISFFDKAIAAGDLLPDQMHVAYLDRGSARGEGGDQAGAAQDFTAALAIRPDDKLTLLARALAYANKGDSDKAMADVATLKKDAPDSDTIRLDCGLVEWVMGRFADAATDFTVWADKGYAYAWLWLQLARLKQDQAIGSYQAPSSDRPGLHIRRALSSNWPRPVIDLYRGDSAEKAVFDAVTAAGGSAGTTCEANFYVGEWRLLHGDTAGGKTLLQKAADDCPKGFEELVMAQAELEKLK